MTNTATNRFAESLKTESIKIYIGPRNEKSTPYLVPKSILCEHSYFSKALSPPFKESQTGVLHFPEDNKEAWEILLYYFFHREVESKSGEDHPDFEDLIPLTHAYLLADKYQLPALQNVIAKAVMDGIGHDRCCCYPGDLSDVMRLVPADCPLRWLFFEAAIMEVCVMEYFSWADFQSLIEFEDGFMDLMECYEEFRRDPKRFPPWEHFDSTNERLKKYFVDESKGDKEAHKE